MISVLVALLVVFGIFMWGLDRHLCLRDLHKDLNNYLGDILVARDSSPSNIKVHFEAQVFALKALIRKNFS